MKSSCGGMKRGIGEDLGVGPAAFGDSLSVGENNMEMMEDTENGTRVSQGGTCIH